MRWRTLVAVHLSLSAAALLLAAPFATLIGATVGRLPEGDLALWSGGGEVAVDAAIRLAPFAGPALVLGGVVFCLWALAAPLATGVLLDAHARSTDPGLSRVGAVARTLWAPFLAQRVAQIIGLVVAVVVGGSFARLADAVSTGWTSAVHQGLLVAAAWLPAVLLAAIACAATDVAHALTVRGARGGLRTWWAAARLTASRPLRMGGPWALTTLAMALVTLVAAMLAERLGGRPGLLALLLFAIQQIVAFGRTALRSAWLETALGLTGHEAAAYAPPTSAAPQ